MKKIKLTQGQFALVDDEDFDKLNKSKWSINRHGKNYYRPKNSRNMLMSRIIMNPPKGMVVDHINHDTLDNRKCNLRICSQTENMMNKKLYKNNEIGFKGVSKTISKYKGKERISYVAQLKSDNDKRYLGIFKNPIDAAKKYDEAVIKHFGEFGLTNEKLGLFTIINFK